MLGRLRVWSLAFTFCVNLAIDLSNVSLWSLTFWYCVKMILALNNNCEHFSSVKDQIDTIPKG